MKYKFKKGGKVEVYNTREAHSGPWRCAEIISGNGHTYSVRYDRGSAVDRVPRKAIRPCPPIVRKPGSCRPGDTVEVFDNSSWKPVEVSRVVGGGYYYVRLLGTSRDFRAHMSELRLRQAWRDDDWVVIGKDSEKHTDDMKNWLPKEGSFSRQNIEVKKHLGDGHFPIENHNDFKELHQGLLRGMKRRSDIEMCSGAGIKVRTIEKEGRCQRSVAMHTPRLQENVDAVASPRKMLGGKYMHASLNNRTSNISETDTRKKIPYAANLCYFGPNLEPSDTESTSSSVGSCGTRNSPYELIHPFNISGEYFGSYSEDAETFHVSGSEPLLPTRKAVAEEIHQLELHAYRTTLVALHASGPISWEQEALLTNLRLTLKISTDEHLSELRNLVAVENNVPLR